DHGLTSADQMVAANLVQLDEGSEGSSTLGWIETVVPASARSITVLLERADGQPIDASRLAYAAEVSIPTASTRQTGERRILEFQQEMIEDARVNLSYAIPEEEIGTDKELLSVLVRTAPGWTPVGVIASEDEPLSTNAR